MTQVYPHADDAQRVQPIEFAPLPEFESPEQRSEYYNMHAKSLAWQLWNTLPGAIMDRFVAELLQRKATQLRVKHQSER